MRAYRLLALGSVAALALGLAACGGSGGSSSAAIDPDPDGDGIPTVDDFFPNNPDRFAAFESFTDPAADTQFSVAVAAADAATDAGASPAVAVGQSDLGGAVLQAQRWSLDPEAAAPGLTAETLLALPGNTYSAAYGVNAGGLAVGESAAGLAPFTTVPVYWAAPETGAAPAATALGLVITAGQVVTTFDAGAAYGVNDAGQIVGEVVRADGSTMAVLWQPDATGAYGEPVELSGFTAGTATTAHYISAAGWVVGDAATADGRRATLWTVTAAGAVDSGPANLGALPGHAASTAWGVDADGRIVGESETAAGETTALLWEAFDGAPASLGPNASAMAVSAGNSRIAGSAATGAELRAAVWDTRSTVLANFDAVLSSGSPNFTPRPGESRAYGMSPLGVVAGISGAKAFVAVPQAPL